jgi:hypothetical protein
MQWGTVGDVTIYVDVCGDVDRASFCSNLFSISSAT